MRPIVLIVCLAFFSNAFAADSTSCTGKLDEHDKKHGVWVCRDHDGKVLKKEKYKHGNLLSYIVYNEKGQIIETRDKKGRVRKYNPCGC